MIKNKNNCMLSALQTVNGKNKTATNFSTALVLLLIILSGPFTVQASRDRYVLELDDAHILGDYGDWETISLTKIFQEQYPRVKVFDLDLREVVLVAKSRTGEGVVQLRVGESVSDNYEVAGRPIDFYDGRNITFEQVHLPNPSVNSRGPWQIDLLGNFIIRKVILETENYRWRRYNDYHRPSNSYYQDRW